MLEAGVSLVSGLDNLAQQEENRALGPTVRQVRHDVESGSTLAAALERHPQVFDPLFVNMVRAGEAGGFLDIVFKRLTLFLEKRLQWRKAVLSASLYPAVVIVTSFLVLGVILVWVIPVFASLFGNLDVPLPYPTRLVMGASGFLSRWGLHLSLATAAAALAGGFYFRSGPGRMRVDRAPPGGSAGRAGDDPTPDGPLRTDPFHPPLQRSPHPGRHGPDGADTG